MRLCRTQFEPTIISAITEGSQAKAGVLDPEGGALTEALSFIPNCCSAWPSRWWIASSKAWAILPRIYAGALSHASRQ